MLILILFAFFSGVVTILSPCILPVLPIVLSSSLTGGKKRPFGIVTGFVLSFTFFTLFLSAIVKATNISADSLRSVAVILLIIFGASLFIPQFQVWMEKAFSKLSSLLSNGILRSGKSTQDDKDNGFISGIPIGASLGLIWAPCVGPIIASVITLAATSTVNTGALFITLSYSLGTAIPMLGITFGGRALLTKVPWLLTRAQTIQKVFGVLMFITAVGIFFNADRQFQTYILTTFPNYGVGLTKFEEIPLVQSALQQFSTNPSKTSSSPNPSSLAGKPINEIQDKTGSNLPKIAKAPGFSKSSGEWINSQPITLESLKGKVVLVDFWTYTCINCIRTLPYIRSWYEKYKDKGLVIVGVHTPEFEFEKTTANVQKAIKDFKLTYPIVQDNNYGIWQDYDNHYWPAHYLIDKDGYIRDEHFGEGAYDETEQNIQTLLQETGETITNTIDNPSYAIQAQTPETYVGYQRVEYSVSPERILPDQLTKYTAPKTIPINRFAYQGSWKIGPEQAMPSQGSKLSIHFSARNVFLVMRPKTSGQIGKVKLSIQDSPVPSTQAGDDVKESMITIDADRLYHLIKLSQSGEGTLHIEFLDNNVEVYAFTFG